MGYTTGQHVVNSGMTFSMIILQGAARGLDLLEL
jgi:hypothetical protein